jgi:hypothetical protein
VRASKFNVLRFQFDKGEVNRPNGKPPVQVSKPLWGTVSWLWTPDELGGIMTRSFTVIVGGVLNKRNLSFVNPAGKVISCPLGMVTVSGFGHSVDLSAQIDRAVALARYLDAELRLIPNRPGGMADGIFSIDFNFTPTPKGGP